MAKFEKGYKMPEDWKQKISESRKAMGDCRSEETKRKMADALSNRTPEQKKLAQLKKQRTLIQRQLQAHFTQEQFIHLEEIEEQIADLEVLLDV